jgi:hypothetical protein
MHGLLCSPILEKKQCTYDVTLKCVRATTLVLEKQELLNVLKVCICIFRYPARNVHAPYCHTWSLWFYNIFVPYLIKNKIFEKNTEHAMCVFVFSTTLFEIFRILIRIEQDIIKMYIGLPVN